MSNGLIGKVVRWEHGPSKIVGTVISYDSEDDEVFLEVDGLMHAHIWAPVNRCVVLVS